MPIVYGNSVDLSSAKTVLGSGFTYVNTESYSQEQLKNMIKASDIIVGGSGAEGGVSFDNGATRLAGHDRQETSKSILDFATQNLYTNFNKMAESIKQSYSAPNPVPSVPSVPSPSLPSSTGNTSSPSTNPVLNLPGIPNPSDALTTPVIQNNFDFNKIFSAVVGLMFVGTFLSLLRGRR